MLALVATGKPNREIAEALFVNERTDHEVLRSGDHVPDIGRVGHHQVQFGVAEPPVAGVCSPTSSRCAQIRTAATLHDHAHWGRTPSLPRQECLGIARRLAVHWPYL